MSTLYLIPLGVFAYVLARRHWSNQDKSLLYPGLQDLEDGPKPYSWIGGNFADLLATPNVGDKDQEYMAKHGATFRLKGTFGRSNTLYIADPKGLNYVLNTRAYTFNRGSTTKISRLFLGPNLLTTEGEEHARQRKIVLPGFSQAAIKNLLSSFVDVTEVLATKWKDLHQSSGEPTVVNVHNWFSRLTLDAVGQGAFSYDFGALGDNPSEYLKAHVALFSAAHKKPGGEKKFGWNLAGLELLGFIPSWILGLICKLIFRNPLIKNFRNAAHNIASEIIQKEKAAAAGQVPEGKDVMSIMVRSNLSEEAKQKMSDEELIGQLFAFTIAAHDPTSGTLSWLFYELARHPDYQEKMRAEIKRFRTDLDHKEPSATDYDSLPITTAAIKETLRLYPFAGHGIRQTTKDEMIPLSKPVKLRNGQLTDHVFLKTGQSVILGLSAYNRTKELWGEDAEIWNPHRFLDERGKDLKHSFGLYANLATFSSGVHGCIGWRFAVLQLHAIAVSLIEKFAFNTSPDPIEVYKAPLTGMLPFVKGQEKDGPQLPLAISLI